MSRHIVGLQVLAVFACACSGGNLDNSEPTSLVPPFARSTAQVPDTLSP